MLEHKTVSLSDCAIKFANTEGNFSGYGSVFDVVDLKNDIIMPGAYADVIKSGNPVHVHVNHGWMRGDLPVGAWIDLKEDSRGLIGDARLEMKMPSATNAYWSIKSGLVTGLSVAFAVDKSAVERRSDGVRVIHSVKMLKEISIVEDPANVESQVLDVKMSEIIDEIETIRDFERFLRDAGTFSKSASVALVARAKKVFQSDSEAPNAKAMQIIADRLAKITQKIN